MKFTASGCTCAEPGAFLPLLRQHVIRDADRPEEGHAWRRHTGGAHRRARGGGLLPQESFWRDAPLDNRRLDITPRPRAGRVVPSRTASWSSRAVRKSKRGGAFYFLALVVIESRAGAAAAKALLGEASLLGVHAALARRREPVRRGRGAARRRPGPATVRQRGRRRGPALRVAALALRAVLAGLREAARRGRGRSAARRRPAGPPSGRLSGTPTTSGREDARHNEVLVRGLREGVCFTYY